MCFNFVRFKNFALLYLWVGARAALKFAPGARAAYKDATPQHWYLLRSLLAFLFAHAVSRYDDIGQALVGQSYTVKRVSRTVFASRKCVVGRRPASNVIESFQTRIWTLEKANASLKTFYDV
jgi:hypothetical protein